MLTAELRAALRHLLEETAGKIPDKFLAGEYRRTLLDRFFASQRRSPPPRPWGGRDGGRGGGDRAGRGVAEGLP